MYTKCRFNCLYVWIGFDKSNQSLAKNRLKKKYRKKEIEKRQKIEAIAAKCNKNKRKISLSSVMPRSHNQQCIPLYDLTQDFIFWMP